MLAGALTPVRMVMLAGWPMALPMLVLGQMFHAITFAAHHTVCIALISHHFPGRLRGRGQALYTVIGYGVPGVPGGVGGGVLSTSWGLWSVFAGAALAGLAALACAFRVWRHAHPFATTAKTG